MFDILYQEDDDSHRACEHLLQFLAMDNCPPILNDIDGKLECFFANQDLSKRLLDSYDLNLVQSERYDHLGDIYLENVVI